MFFRWKRLKSKKESLAKKFARGARTDLMPPPGALRLLEAGTEDPRGSCGREAGRAKP